MRYGPDPGSPQADHPPGRGTSPGHPSKPRAPPGTCSPTAPRHEVGTDDHKRRTVNPLMLRLVTTFLTLPQGRPCGRRQRHDSHRGAGLTQQSPQRSDPRRILHLELRSVNLPPAPSRPKSVRSIGRMCSRFASGSGFGAEPRARAGLAQLAPSGRTRYAVSVPQIAALMSS
jgi:hypothetical protein